MDLGLRDKKALITGSTAGIGLAAALALAREGAHVIVNGRPPRRVDDAVAHVRGAVAGAAVDGIALDLATADGCRQLVERLPQVDILVNNLGIFEPKPSEGVPDGDWLPFFGTK